LSAGPAPHLPGSRAAPGDRFAPAGDRGGDQSHLFLGRHAAPRLSELVADVARHETGQQGEDLQLDAYPRAFGGPRPAFEDWLTHPDADDAYRKGMDLGAAADGLAVPVSLATGWWDLTQAQTLQLRHRGATGDGRPDGRQRHNCASHVRAGAQRGLAVVDLGVLSRRYPPDRGVLMSLQALFYLIAIILLVLAALPIGTRGFSLALLGAAFALLAYSWNTITG
jgi:hypothetical protein